MKIERVAVEQGRRHVRRASAAVPKHALGAGDVARRSNVADRHHGPPVVGAAGIDAAAAGHRRGTDVLDGHAATLPDDFASCEVVALHSLRAADNHLRLAFVVNDEWGGPRRHHVTFNLPAFFSGPFVEGNEERLAFAIPVDDERVAIKGRGTALAVAVGGMQLAQVGRPLEIAVEIETVKAPGAEIGEETLAVGHGRGRGEACGDVPAFVGEFLANGSGCA